MRKTTGLIALLWPVFLTMTGPVQEVSADAGQMLTIGAANSLKEALRAVLPLFEKEHPTAEIRVVWGPSQTLRDQITEGAPIDVFLPSSLEEIDQLEKKGLTLPGTTAVYAKTALVLIAQSAFPTPVTAIEDLSSPDVRRIAIGNPNTSSVGKFAAEALKRTGLDRRVKSRCVYAEHSGAVLDLVGAGEADVGLVYRTDAIRSKKVRIVAEIPSDAHLPIVYGVAAVWTSRNPSLAMALQKFLMSPAIQDVLKLYGFEPYATNQHAAPPLARQTR
ncbi:molybdate ABC transporter substrate-binding protein [Candidatus Nitrospira bockiana]